MPAKTWRNWSGSVQCAPNHVAVPLSLEEVQAEVLRCAEDGERLRVIGSGGAYSPLGWSDENLMSLQLYRGVERVDLDAARAWVRAGTPLHVLARELAGYGLALPRLSDSGMETVGGLLATGAHASGLQGGGVAEQVQALRMVCADGSVRSFSPAENADWLPALRLNLGVLGVVTHVQLQCRRPFQRIERVDTLPLRDALQSAAEDAAAHAEYSLSWVPGAAFARRRRVSVAEPDATPALPRLPALLREQTEDWLEARLRRLPGLARRHARHRVRRGVQECRTPGTAYAGAPLLRRYNEAEYYIALAGWSELANQADRLMRTHREGRGGRLILRFRPGDGAWLSPTQGRDAASVILQLPAGAGWDGLLAAAEDGFARLDARPHWGKLHRANAAQLMALYPRWRDFAELRAQLDRRGVFLNPHVGSLFGVTTP